MFNKLQQKWKVNGVELILIFCTFALGGSLCGYAGRRLLVLTGLEKGALWIILYMLLITLLWPLCVLLISIPLGQFGFFKKYVSKIGNRMLGNKAATVKPTTSVLNIAIFASGEGSNAKKIIEHFASSHEIKIGLIVCNKPGAGVLQIAALNNISVLLIEKERFFSGDGYLPEFENHQIRLIVLAGFLWKLPEQLIKAYPKKIINIHPALLPKHGGKGMYGHYVHEAVIANKEKESGISIHYVDELYDHGEIIFQARCTVDENEMPDSLANKIHGLEHEHYPKTIEAIIKKQNRS